MGEGQLGIRRSSESQGAQTSSQGGFGEIWEIMSVSKISSFFKEDMWKFPNLSVVYRQRAGKPNSSGCLENDFCAAAKGWRPHRVTMDSGYADAQLFCNCNLALVESLGKANIKSYNSTEDVDKRMPEKGFGAGMYEEEDDAQHESGEREVVRMFRRAENPTVRDVTPALGCEGGWIGSIPVLPVLPAYVAPGSITVRSRFDHKQ